VRIVRTSKHYETSEVYFVFIGCIWEFSKKKYAQMHAYEAGRQSPAVPPISLSNIKRNLTLGGENIIPKLCSRLGRA